MEIYLNKKYGLDKYLIIRQRGHLLRNRDSGE